MHNAVRDVYQNHQKWAAAGTPISSTFSGNYILANADVCYSGMRSVSATAFGALWKGAPAHRHSHVSASSATAAAAAPETRFL